MDWYAFLMVLLAMASGIITAAVTALAWGPGAISRLGRDINVLANRVEDVDERITREVKSRAGLAGVDAKARRRTDADVLAEAQDKQAQLDIEDAPAARGSTFSVVPGASGRVRTRR